MATEKKAAVVKEETPVISDEKALPEQNQEVKTDLPVQEGKDEEHGIAKSSDVVGKIKNITLKLPEDIHRKLKAKCALDGMSTGNALKRLIEDYIKV